MSITDAGPEYYAGSNKTSSGWFKKKADAIKSLFGAADTAKDEMDEFWQHSKAGRGSTKQGPPRPTPRLPVKPPPPPAPPPKIKPVFMPDQECVIESGPKLPKIIDLGD